MNIHTCTSFPKPSSWMQFMVITFLQLPCCMCHQYYGSSLQSVRNHITLEQMGATCFHWNWLWRAKRWMRTLVVDYTWWHHFWLHHAFLLCMYMYICIYIYSLQVRNKAFSVPHPGRCFFQCILNLVRLYWISNSSMYEFSDQWLHEQLSYFSPVKKSRLTACFVTLLPTGSAQCTKWLACENPNQRALRDSIK